MLLCQTSTTISKCLVLGGRAALQPYITQTLLQPQILAGASQSRGLKDHLRQRGIEWRPVLKVPTYHPSRAGDLEAFNAPDKSRPVLAMRLIMDEYDEASPRAQQLLSLEFATVHEMLKVAVYDALRITQRHQHDMNCKQVGITILTQVIRYHQQPQFQERLKKFPQRRVRLKEMVEKRYGLLCRLRNEDYKQFEWIIEKLNLVYKPFPRYPRVPVKKTRYDHLSKLVEMRCEKLREKKMAAYKKQLEAQQAAFQQEMKETLQWIKEKEEELGVEITVDPDIGMIEPYVQPDPTTWERTFKGYLNK
uniref:Small ribosomal subunit protein uS15m n=1 Tax=Hirondellea gigas TaxID=1518452 RepID=A0A2P2HZ41_9CRUS